MAESKPAEENVPEPKNANDNDNDNDNDNNDSRSVHSEPDSLQVGVQKALILKKAWSRKALIAAFAALIFSDLMINLKDYSGMVYQPYATSDFQQHSLLSVVSVVNGIVQTCVYPIFAKLCDVFGRGEMFVFAVITQTLGMILYASSKYIDQYAASGIFDSVGSTAFGLTELVFIADATSLVNRGLWTQVPQTVATLPAIYLGTIIGENMLKHSSWRWGWGMWSIIFPCCSVPLITIMFVLQKRAARHGWAQKPKSVIAGYRKGEPLWKSIVHLIWVELDFPGAILLLAGLSLILIPLSLTGSNNLGRWKEPSFIAMLILGLFVLVAFVVWDARYSRKPLIPYRMVKNTTVIAGCIAAAFDFMSYVIFTTYFPSYLQVPGGYSPGHATRIDNALRISAQVFSLLVGLGMKYTKRSKMWVLMGPPVTVLSQGIFIYIVDMGYGSNGNEAAFVTAKVLNGFGRACLQTAGLVTVQAVVPKQQVAVVTAVFEASQTMASAIGTSISGAIWRDQLPKQLARFLPENEQQNATAIFASIKTAQQYLPGTPGRDAINQSYREAQRTLAIAGTAAAVPVLIAILFMKDIRLDQEDAKATPPSNADEGSAVTEREEK